MTASCKTQRPTWKSCFYLCHKGHKYISQSVILATLIMSVIQTSGLRHVDSITRNHTTGLQDSNIRVWTPRLRYQDSDIGHQDSDIRTDNSSQTPGLKHQDTRTWTSGHQELDIWSHTSGFWTCLFYSMNICLSSISLHLSLLLFLSCPESALLQDSRTHLVSHDVGVVFALHTCVCSIRVCVCVCFRFTLQIGHGDGGWLHTQRGKHPHCLRWNPATQTHTHLYWSGYGWLWYHGVCVNVLVPVFQKWDSFELFRLSKTQVTFC